MEARPCSIVEFFNGTKQMMVPLFQRSYEWNKTNWDALWSNLVERYEHSGDTAGSTHFTGAIHRHRSTPYRWVCPNIC